MIEYSNLEELKKAFLSFDIPALPNALNINGIVFTETSTHLNENIIKSEYSATSGSQTITFIWENFHQIKIPSNVTLLESETNDVKLSLEEPITIIGLNNEKPFNAKIDTGADMCSLHANGITIDQAHVTFKINGDTYKMLCHKVVEIQNAEGIEKRPTVLFNVKMKNCDLSNVEFNLNDRSAMDCEVLIGTNLLKQTDFVIDVNESEVSVDIDNNQVYNCQERLEYYIQKHFPKLTNDEKTD